jgi:hypothetical protein
MTETEPPKIVESSPIPEAAPLTQPTAQSALNFTELPFILNTYRMMIFSTVVSAVVLFYIVLIAWGLL